MTSRLSSMPRPSFSRGSSKSSGKEDSRPPSRVEPFRLSSTSTNGLAPTPPVPGSPSSVSGASDRASSIDGENDLDDEQARASIHYPAMVTPTALTNPGAPWPFSASPDGVRSPDRRDSLVVSQPLAATVPHEILLHILRLVPSPSDLKSCVLVCKSWCQCGVELLWHKPVFHSTSGLLKNLRILSIHQQTFPYANFIKRLNFSALADHIDDQILRRLTDCERLERLTLANARAVTDSGVCRLLMACKFLVALDLSECTKITDETVLHVATICRRLQGLNLSGCKLVTDSGLEAIAKSCSYLRRIKLRNLVAITDDPIILLAQKCSFLLEVDLIQCPGISNAALWACWRHLSALREFSLGNCVRVSNDGFPLRQANKVITGGARPEDVDLCDQPVRTKMVGEPLILWSPLAVASIDHLRYLDLTALTGLTDEAIGNIVTCMPRIRNLILAKCTNLSDQAILSVCKLGRHLHYLHLGHVSSITDGAVMQLARSCTRLRYIDLACCPLLTDMGVTELAQHLQRLKRIGLVRVSNLTDQAIYALVERTSLERIHLSYCEHVTVPAIHYLLQHLQRLTHLSLTGVPAFRRRDLQDFCRAPPKDFNTHQRQAFCVYSGKGVQELRKYLAPLHASQTFYANEAARDAAANGEVHHRRSSRTRQQLAITGAATRGRALGIGGSTSLRTASPTESHNSNQTVQYENGPAGTWGHAEAHHHRAWAHDNMGEGSSTGVIRAPSVEPMDEDDDDDDDMGTGDEMDLDR